MEKFKNEPPEYVSRWLKGNETSAILSADTAVRDFFAENALEAEILKLLAVDKHPGIRCAVALNDNTPPEALARLSEDRFVAIQWLTARHHNTPLNTLRELAMSSDLATAEAARKNINGRGRPKSPWLAIHHMPGRVVCYTRLAWARKRLARFGPGYAVYSVNGRYYIGIDGNYRCKK